MSKVERFIEAFEYWRVKLKLKPIPFKQDNRYGGHVISCFDDDKIVLIKYNSKKLKEWNYPLIMCGVFHELAHIVEPSLPYNTDEDKVKEEYRAERWALDMMKKHYPFMIEPCVVHIKKRLKSPKWCKQYPVHFKAFSQIKEYMI